MFFYFLGKFTGKDMVNSLKGRFKYIIKIDDFAGTAVCCRGICIYEQIKKLIATQKSTLEKEMHDENI